MLTITKDAQRISGVKNDISVSLKTDVDAAGVRHRCRLTLSNADINAAINGVKIIFTWNSGNSTLEFTCNSSGGTNVYYPRSLFINDSQFIDGLAGVLAATDQFAQFFKVFRDGITNSIIIEARFVGPFYSILVSGTQPLSVLTIRAGLPPVSGYTVYLEIYEEEPYGSNDFRPLIGMQLYPDESKTFDVNLKRVLQNPDMVPSRILPSIPQDNSLVAELNNSAVRRFFYKLSELSTASLTGAGSRITSEVKYTLLAGVNYQAVLKGFILEDYLSQLETPFLTWSPEEKLIAKDQPDFLYFFLMNENNYQPGAETKLYADITFEDGTTLMGQAVLSIPGFLLNQLYIIPTGFFQLNLQSYGADIQSYSVYVFHNGNRISKKKKYRVDWRCPDDRQFFIFQNSLGGMDVLYCKGLECDNNTIESSAERVFYDDRPDNFENSQYFTYEKVGRSTFTTTTQLMDKEGLLYLSEFFNSKSIFHISGGRYIPVMLTKMNQALFKQRPDLQSVTIEYQYAFDDNGYTPR